MANKKTGDKTGAEVEINARDNTKRAFDSAMARLKSFGQVAQNVGSHMLRIGAGMTAFGGSILTGLAAAGVQFSSLGDSVAKAAARMGTTTETVSALRVAADLSGTSISALEGAWRIMQRRIAEASRGSMQAQRALDSLGLSVDMLTSLTPEQQFAAIGDAISKIDDPTMRAAAAMEVFGRSGSQLLPLFANGIRGVAEAMAFARENGLVITPQDARKAEVLNDALGTLKLTLQDVAFEIGAAVAPAMIMIADGIRSASVSVAKFISRNRGLVVAVGIGAAAITAAGIALTTLGGITVAVGATLIALQPIIAITAAAWNILAASATAAWLAMTGPAALIVIGVGAIAAALVALNVRILAAQGAFTKLGSVFSETWDEITAELASGSLENAFMAALAGVDVAWKSLFEELSRGWLDLIRSIGGGGTVLEAELEAWVAVFHNATNAAKRQQRKLQQALEESRMLDRTLEERRLSSQSAHLPNIPEVEAAVKGTFSGFSAGLLGRAADNFSARTAEATEEAVDKLDEIAGTMSRIERMGGAVFA